MKTSIDQALVQLPAAPTDIWPQGAPFRAMLASGTMTVEVFAPGLANADEDLQTMHTQDELYFVQGGRAELVIKDQRFRAAAGDAFFVPAGIKHRFENFSSDFVTWVVFYGPQGGERYACVEATRLMKPPPKGVYEVEKEAYSFTGLSTSPDASAIR